MTEQLETPRLLLRRFTPADADDLMRVHAHPEVYRYLSDGQPWDRPKTDSVLQRYLDNYAATSYGPMAVVRKADGVLIGRCGIRLWRADEVAPELQGPELGYSFAREVWGMGYALEATRVVLQHADRILGLPWTFAFIRPGNAASQKLADKLGYRPQFDAQLVGGPVEVWRRERPASIPKRQAPPFPTL